MLLLFHLIGVHPRFLLVDAGNVAIAPDRIRLYL
jgi:hypothetical protein